jgi:hypothetical protein
MQKSSADRPNLGGQMTREMVCYLNIGVSMDSQRMPHENRKSHPEIRLTHWKGREDVNE